jgi:hypothetical protein
VSENVALRFGDEVAARVGARELSGASLAELRAKGSGMELHLRSITEAGGLRGCAVCGHPELFTRKDFPRFVGFAIVVVAAVLAPATHYVSLFVAAAADFVLYRIAGNVVQCYVCGSEHRGFAPDPRHPAFDREIHERLEYGTRAVMGKPMRAGGTANAPDPEH